jgi:hypothetical protein
MNRMIAGLWSYGVQTDFAAPERASMMATDPDEPRGQGTPFGQWIAPD